MFLSALSPIRRVTAITLLSLSGLLITSCQREASSSEAAAFLSGCTSNPGQGDHCTPLLACFDNGQSIHGATLGWLSGNIEGKTQDGVACRGKWEILSTSDASGSAQFICEDGSYGNASFSYDRAKPGTIWGRGEFNASEAFQVWGGRDLIQRLQLAGGHFDQLCDALNGLKERRSAL